MTWRLLEDVTKTLEIEGVTIHVKPLTGAQLLTLRSAFDIKEDGMFDGDMERVIAILGKSITKIDGFGDKTPVEVLTRVAEPMIIAKIVTEVMALSSLTEDEIKNSNSSSGLPSSAGDVPDETASEKAES